MVYQANQTISTTGWYTFTFTTPFVWNGTQNVEVDVCFNNSSYSSSGEVYCFNGYSSRSKYYRCDSCTCGTDDPLTWTCMGYWTTDVPRAVFVMTGAPPSQDCNNNGIPDECDLSAGTSTDLNGNGVPDECEPDCLGDLNCDGVIDFGDINPFVLHLCDFVTWQTTYLGCNPQNGDINCDGTYGQSSFGDINPFVNLVVQCATGCPCPGPISCP